MMVNNKELERLMELKYPTREDMRQMIYSQEKRAEDYKSLVEWMTGCGYDFTQHKYFRDERKRLL